MADNINNFKENKSSKKGMITIIIVVIVIGVVIAIASAGVYTVDATELGILIRFGKVIDGNVTPGLKFKIPFVDEVEIVDVSSKKVEFGYRTAKASLERSDYQEVDEESRMLTGDLNIADIEWVIQYEVIEPYQYVFKIVDADSTLRDLSEAIMRRFIGNMSLLEEIVTTGEAGATNLLQENLRIELQKSLDNLQTGLRVTDVFIQNFKNADDPEVEQAFAEVVSAEQEQKTIIEQAREKQSQRENEIKGKALKMVEEAKGYKEERINRAKGDVASFEKLYNQYKLYPSITKKRMYIETISELYEKLKKVTIVDADLMTKTLPLLNLNKGGNQ